MGTVEGVCVAVFKAIGCCYALKKSCHFFLSLNFCHDRICVCVTEFMPARVFTPSMSETCHRSLEPFASDPAPPMREQTMGFPHAALELKLSLIMSSCDRLMNCVC